MISLNTRKNAAQSAFGDDESSAQDMSDRNYRSRAVEVDAPSSLRVWFDSTFVALRILTSSSQGFGTNQHTLSIKVATETVRDIDDTKVSVRLASSLMPY